MGHWLDHIAAARVRPSTLEGYRSKVRTRIVPTLGHFRLDSLQPEHVEAWRDEMLADGLAPASVLQCQRVLSRALKVAMQRVKVARNVSTSVDSPPLTAKKCSHSQPRRPAECWRSPPISATPPTGRWHSR